MPKPKWWNLGREGTLATDRMPVWGGWLVRVYGSDGEGLALTFVPDPQHKWSLAEARDSDVCPKGCGFRLQDHRPGAEECPSVVFFTSEEDHGE